MLGTVLLSQHRFRDAIREAERAREIEPRDAWNYGVIGDAHLELGEYEGAFAAFDRMSQLRPGPMSYARVAYALELKGDLQGALESMKMAADGTSAHDAEGQAWHFAQLGNLLLQVGRIGEAKREFERAAFTFPDHPYAMAGLAKVKAAGGDSKAALAMYSRLLAKQPTPELAAIVGDLHKALGDGARAEEMYVMAETLERDGWATEEPQPQALARFLAERDRKIPEAVKLAEEAAAKRRDIYTMDALAWSYFKAGRLADARKAADAAMRTGTRDPRIVAHAEAIRSARAPGELAGAKSENDGDDDRER
jgi:tetratricopeptide (TPR) repeat protein